MQLPLPVRLTLVLLGTAGFSTAVALMLQERSLARDLERAAQTRLAAAARAAGRLMDGHLRATLERYRAIAGTPQLRATLEVGDPPTLAHYAEEVARAQAAARVLFVDAAGQVVAGAGDAELDPPVPGSVEGASLMRWRQWPFAVIGLSLETAGRPVGRLVAVERVSGAVVREWSRLCGAKILFHGERGGVDTLTSRVPGRTDLGIRVRISIAAERRALVNAHRRLIAAGSTGLVLALGASLLWSRRLARAVRGITTAAERIGRGDFAVRIASPRRDEVGDVARSVDAMAARLEAAREVQLETERAKSEFLANVSHEMRTPMHGIFGLTEMMLEGPLPSEQRDCAERVRRCAEGLLHIIDDLLDLSGIEAGKLALETVDFDPEQVIEEAVGVLAQPAAAKGLELMCLVQGPAHRRLRGDPGRLRQVLVNLVGNAVKFTEQGEVVVRAELVRQAGGHVLLRCTVADTGIGIPAEAVHRLFQSFSQVDGSMSRQYGGTGLGLAIARRLVEMMGGAIDVESEPGRGSTFRFAARFEEGATTGTEEVDMMPAALRATPVLVVSDHATSAALLQQRLAGWGMCEVQVASTADLMVHLRDAVREGRPHRVVLLDVRVPGPDGPALVHAIEESPECGAPAVILVAPLAHPEVAQVDGTGRVAGSLTRPVRGASLRTCLIRGLAGARVAA